MTAQDCLLITDLQNDFCPGGALAVKGGDQIVEAINRIQKRFSLVVTTQDWHPEDHSSFKDQGGPWPSHCVRDTWGASLHPRLDTSKVAFNVRKAKFQDRDAYSVFQETILEEELKKRKVKRVFIVGLTTDYCVKETALDALHCGFETIVLTDCIRAVNMDPHDGERALEEIRKAGAILATRSDLEKGKI